MDHMQNWIDADSSVFWDVSNVAFSHVLCNVRASRGHSNVHRSHPDGTHWCSKHKGYLPQSEFYVTRQSPTGLPYWCKGCKSEMNRKRSRKG